MRHATSALVLGVLVLCVPSAVHAQTVIDPGRRIDWSRAGVVGGIPQRAAVCQTLSPGATATDINTAIATCHPGQVVFLGAGTYNIGAPGIVFNNKSNVTLRGSGANQTFLVFSNGSGCTGLGALVCVRNDDANWSGQPSNIASWTAGYAPGTTSITLSHTTNLRVGSILILDQVDDTVDDGTVFNCAAAGACTQQGPTGIGRANRAMHQTVHVVAINGNVVTITPGLYMPVWRAGQSPAAWWANTPPVIGVGIEDLSLDYSAVGRAIAYGIFFHNAANSWVKNVRSLNADTAHINLYQSVHNTIRDSYFYGTQMASSLSYGIEPWLGDDNLVENNIFQHVAAPMMNDGAQGAVYAYNYAIDDYFVKGDPAWMQSSSYHHGPGNGFILWEGNEGIGLTADDIHGNANFVTAFRNRFHGYDADKTHQTVAVHLYARNRFFNIVGNVLGEAGYHTLYTSQVTDTAVDQSTCWLSIYALGFGGNCENGGSAPFPTDDALVATTLMRWGNYDTVSNAVRFVAAEVPSTLGQYANPVPATQALPASLYLVARPPWWTTPWGTPQWPPIGPDVSGGNVPDLGGHVDRIPARLCYEQTPKVNNVLTFDAGGCYARTAPPSPPRNLVAF